MSGREFQPGDVAMVDLGDQEHVAILIGDELGEHCWHSAYASGDLRCTRANAVTVRPLAVIDPEDREQVERLNDAIHDAMHNGKIAWAEIAERVREEWLDRLQDGLREFASPKPPRPAEPTAFGALVLDARGVAWSKRADGSWNSGSGDIRLYAEINAVAILSPGLPDA